VEARESTVQPFAGNSHLHTLAADSHSLGDTMSNPIPTLRRPPNTGLRSQQLAEAPAKLGLPSVVLIAAAILAGCGGGDDAPPAAAAPQATAQDLCNGLLGREFEGAVVTKATLVAAAGTTPEYCLVRGEMPEDLDFEVRMPTTWNKRTVFIGGGGFDGSITTSAFSPGVAQAGYATIATNHGHNADVTPGATFALDQGMLQDYAYLAVPRVLASAKAILRGRYGSDFDTTKFVYEGCSGGGRQGLIEAQRYPELFDGVISRAPANAYTPQFLWYQKVQKALAQPGAALSAAKYQAIDNATTAKCDALDGVADHIITRPDLCTFDPAELACTGAETNSCLTPAQIQSARTLYAPTDVANGRYKWTGFWPGGEAAGGLSAAAESFRVSLGQGYIQYMVAQNPSVDWLQLDPAAYTSRIDQLVTMIDAVNPDLSRFKAHGGKLILWHGLSDWLISPQNTIQYYNSVVQQSGGQAQADEFVEFYTAPSVQHCLNSFPGTGPVAGGADLVDLVTPMFAWLEKGIKPSTARIVAKQTAAGTPGGTRPLCKYPAYPKYNGSGDINADSSYTCTAP